MKPEYPIKIEGTTVIIPSLNESVREFANWAPFYSLDGVPLDPKVEETVDTIDDLCREAYRYKAYYGRAVAMKTGYGPKALTGIVMRALKKIWFVEPWSTRLALGRRGNYNVWVVDLIYKNQGVIAGYEADNQRNMVPLGLVMGMSAPELRAYVGKRCWKRLIHNSVSRNVLIARAVIHCNQDGHQETFRVASRLPSTFLKLVPQRRDVRFMLSALELRPMNSLAKNNGRLLVMLHDLVERGDGPRRPIRSPADIEREHERAFDIERGYPVEIDYTDLEPAPCVLPELKLPPFEGEVDGVTYKMLRTREEYKAEGKAKHHCVAAYYSSAARGEYIVLSLSGKVSATAGYRLVDGTIKFDQCYGVCNRPVESWPRAQIFARLAKYVEELNRA